MELKRREVEEEYKELINRITNVFTNELGKQNAEKYIKGLLGSAKRKNGWQMSEYLGETTPYALQQFIYRGRFKADEIRNVMRNYIWEKLGEEDGVLVVDETGFLKQGNKSCGVKRQYSGTAGRVENCQIGVFLTYASSKGHSPIDRRLYMPQEWITNEERRKSAGVPDDLTFQTKPQMALEMIRQATEAGMPYKWAAGDCVYGDYTDIRMWLENNGKNYVMSVSGKSYVWQGFHQHSVANVMKNLPEEGWVELSCGDGSKGPRVYDWMAIPINPPPIEGFKRILLFRRSKTNPEEIRAYICFASDETDMQKFVEIAGKRWSVESCFKESKSEVGLDQYEVRSYDGWYKHITFACIALAFITVLSCQSLDGKALQEHNPASSSLDEFKKGRNLPV